MRTHCKTSKTRTERGAGLVETIVVLPTLLLVIMCIWQAALVYRAKSALNYAALEAARAGSVENATVSSIQTAFRKALIPYYGGGRTYRELETTLERMLRDIDDPERSELLSRIEILSPTQESFTDYQSAAAQTALNEAAERAARREGRSVPARITEPVLPNVGLDRLVCPRDNSGCNSDPARNQSGQTLLDANLLKLRITYGIPPSKQMPLAGRLYTWALNALRAGEGDAFKQTLLQSGRIPIVVHTTVRMQSDAIRNTAMISSPGPGNNGTPTDPGPPPGDPPTLPSCGFNDPACGNPSIGPGSGGGNGGGPSCNRQTLIETGSSDVLFDFDSATINAAGRRMLDQVIANMRGRAFDRLTLTGYTDQIGDDAYNQGLSERRANAVRTYLLNNGLSGRDIRAVGRGEQDPVVELSACPAGPRQIACLAPNRRVIFTFEGLR
jgi:outer membrane protein OmpA-like peptidoglycan-associated protein